MEPNHPGDSPRHSGNLDSSLLHAQSGSDHQTPRKRRFARSTGVPNDGRHILIAVLALVLLCGGVGAAVYSGVQKTGDAIITSLTEAQAARQVGFFCTYVVTQNYSMAYHLLSAAKQGNVSESDFATHAAALDESDGWAVTCAIAADHPHPTISDDGKSATAWIQVARGENAKIVSGAMKLVLEDSEWKIDSADAALKLL